MRSEGLRPVICPNRGRKRRILKRNWKIYVGPTYELRFDGAELSEARISCCGLLPLWALQGLLTHSHYSSSMILMPAARQPLLRRRAVYLGHGTRMTHPTRPLTERRQSYTFTVIHAVDARALTTPGASAEARLSESL